jgi:pimeloyl-ACP methyl ester carboxylesterase
LSDGVGKFCWAGAPTEVTVTLVGHSMGAMVINRLLQVSEDPSLPAGSPTLPIERIIYLAPACSINEAEQLLMPYLDRHPNTHFWLFTLNKRDESREIPFRGWAVMVPRGTLLAWIDTFLETEVGPGEGRLGWVKRLEEFYGVSDHKPSSRALLSYFTSASEPWRPLAVNWPLNNDPLRLHTYSSQRRVFDHSAPEHHEDFLKPEHFKTILCKVVPTMFKTGDTCQP